MDLDLIPYPIDHDSAIQLAKFLRRTYGTDLQEIADELNRRGYMSPSGRVADRKTVDYFVYTARENKRAGGGRRIIVKEPEKPVYSTTAEREKPMQLHTHPDSKLDQEAAIELTKEMYTSGSTTEEIVTALNERGYRSSRTGQPANVNLVYHFLKDDKAPERNKPMPAPFSEAQAIELVKERYAEGAPYRLIARELKSKGYVTAKGVRALKPHHVNYLLTKAGLLKPMSEYPSQRAKTRNKKKSKSVAAEPKAKRGRGKGRSTEEKWMTEMQKIAAMTEIPARYRKALIARMLEE